MALEREYEVFKQKLPDLLRTMKGKFVLIHGGDVDGPWEEEDAAYTAGCQKFGTDPFLVMLVVEQEEPVRFFQDVPGSLGHRLSPGLRGAGHSCRLVRLQGGVTRGAALA